MRTRQALVGLAFAAATAATITWTAASRGEAPPSEDAAEHPVLLISGRDDHGLLATPTVQIARRPEGPEVAELPDGALVAVVRSRGEWVEVRSLTGPAVHGWVNDFYLRGTVHLRAAAGMCEVAIADRPAGVARHSAPANSQAAMQDLVGHDVPWVLVELDGKTAGWVPAEVVHELPGDRVQTHDGTCSTVGTPALPHAGGHDR